MSEINIEKIEKKDIQAPPPLATGSTAIVLQRHERYDRDRASDTAGSILPEEIEAAKVRDTAFFEQLLEKEEEAKTYVLFVSSDTQYAGRGRRSLETAQLAQETASKVMTAMDIDPQERIINLNPSFKVNRTPQTDQPIRSMPQLREPQIFDNLTYVTHLIKQYGDDGSGGLSQAAWAAHEADTEKLEREKLGAEGVNDILDRTKAAIRLLEHYSRIFHINNPNSRLIIWAASHYDTISPLVKDATETNLSEFIPVEYGGGVIITIPPGGHETILEAQGQKIPLYLGKTSLAATSSVSNKLS